MNGYFVSLLVGLVVGAAYGLLQVRSPAPPLIALVGLLGMVLGEGAIDLARQQLRPELQGPSQSAPDNVQGPGSSHGG
jgi:XapX domain-containing protein